ncbi:MAG: BON domain-containing protein [Burkholderiales bacterium]|nr:BON domain-containing protein [Burkholderiales bacterium]
MPDFPEKEVKIEAVSGAVVLNGVVPGAAEVRRAWLVTRRIAGIKTLDNRLVSGELLAWD